VTVRALYGQAAMSPRHGATTLVVAAALVAGGCSDDGGGNGASGPREPAQAAVVVNADVWTGDLEGTQAEAFAYDGDGELVAVGTEAEARAAAGAEADEIDAGGNMVLPGFQDSHVHVPEAGINETLCYLPPIASMDRYEALAADCAAERPDDEWVRAVGPSLYDLPREGALPIDVLDRAVPDRPALILDDLGHAVWANSLALEAAGVTEDDPDPQGGVFDRDPASGRLTGLLLENAQHRVRDVAAADPGAVYAGLRTALGRLARNGVTTVSDAGGFWAQGHTDAWERALDEGALTVRAVNSLYLYPDRDVDAQLDEFADRYRGDPDSLLRFDTAKIYLDGILDLTTAALVDPYLEPEDPSLSRGFAYFDPDELTRYAEELHDLGFQFNFHVIGDGAARTALDTVEALDAPDVRDRHHRATHLYLVHPDDVGRFAGLGVVADFQQSPFAIDAGYRESLAPLIGPRAERLIPTRELVEAGALVTLSSDWDADPLSPLGTIERAVTRDTQAVADVETAVRMMTLDAARALRHDDRTGSIEVGKQADFVIVDRDLFAIAPDDVDEAKVLLTAVAGREVWRDPTLRVGN
jgi:predicted amidohydrolase YtcJ